MPPTSTTQRGYLRHNAQVMTAPAPRRALGTALVVLGAVLFIVNAGVSRVALRHGIDSAQLTSLRVTGTFVALLLLALVVERSALRVPRGRSAWVVVAMGILGVAALQFFYFVAIDRLTIGLALLLEYQAPFLVALWARYVQRAQVSSRLWWGLGLAVAGLAAATEAWRGASFDTIGLAAGFGAAVTFAAYFLLGEEAQTEMSSVSVMLWAFGVGAVVLNVAAPVWRVDVDLGAHVSLLGALDHLSAPLWLVVVWVVLLGTLAPFGVELVALRHIPATTVTAIAMLEPVGAAALGWAWFAESLSLVASVGCVTVVVGILLAQSSRTEDHPDDPVPLT